MSLWTDERVDETVTSAYVYSHLRPNEQELLQRALYFGGDLTDDTYLEWILTRLKRFFLILVATGVPDQIFGIIDDSFDDEDLPIIEAAVPDLRLSYEPDRALDKRFYKNQFKFLTRVVGEGEHIRYADEESVPVLPLNLKSVLSLGHDTSDKVRLPSTNQKIYVRRRIKLDGALTEEDILNEIATSRRLCHEHIVSVYGSYMYQGSFNVLSLPAPEWTLKTFLTDNPKSFGALPKKERRQILINWPHCLANGLAWLHDNGEFHGAIRPSNIQIDESYRISFGFLDGEGLLRVTARSDDIEAYQYGPPERWKRAVTLQSTGSGAVSLPSGGRSGRKTTHAPRSNTSGGSNSARSRSVSSTATYKFQPTSRGNYARLRLSSAGPSETPPPSSARGRDVMSPTDSRSVSSYNTARRVQDPVVPGKPPSVLSSNSSNGKKSGPPIKYPMFVSAPEGRSAVVQTWQSVEQDMFASDIFSLGAVIMDILNLLCKRTNGAFQRHRSSKNRMAGRGGGLADASFHANLGQVFLWAQSLQKDAEKKAKKAEGEVYHAVGSIVQLALQCLERDPSIRLSSGQLEKRMGEHIQRFASVERLHCAAELKRDSKPKLASLPVRARTPSDRAVSQLESQDRVRQASPNPSTLASVAERPHPRPMRIVAETPTLLAPLNHTPSTAPVTPAATSVSSLLSFNFDGLSDTVVAESPRSREQSRRRTGTREFHDGYRPPMPVSNDQDTPEKEVWQNWHNNDSQLDPRLSFGESVDAGAFTYLNYSTSASSDEGVKYFPRPPADKPPKPPPERGLPPIPPLPTKARSAKPNQRVPRRDPSNTDAAVSNHRSNAGPGGRPLRVDSLHKDMGLYEEDSHDIIRNQQHPPATKVSSRSRTRQDQYLLRQAGYRA